MNPVSSKHCRACRRGLATLVLAALAAMTASGAAVAADDPSALFVDGKPTLDVRYRFEAVDQDGRSRDAAANTIRTRFGFETGRVNGFGAFAELEWVKSIGEKRFNDTINGDTRYPVVADPDDMALNQLYLVSDGTIPDSTLKLGRQRVIWDNARFIGNVGFRQNEQTLDAARASTRLLPATELEYLYIEEVHRIFGRDSAVGSFKLEGHGLRAVYSGLKPLTVTPFALFLDYDRTSQAANSSATVGSLLSLAYPLGGDWGLRLNGAVARQVDHGNNPADFRLWYYQVEPGVTYGDWTVAAGMEQLDGNGTSAFQTPLATLHAFNGITDQFLTTPTGGLRDYYLKAQTMLPPLGPVSGVKLQGAYHQFSDDDGSVDFGSEWSLGVAKSVKTGLGPITLAIEYADYDADSFSVDTSKLWLTVAFKLQR